MITTDTFQSQIAAELGISTSQISNTLNLLDDGATVPFIARYRKERTGSLDEVMISSIKEKREKYSEFLKRRQAILQSLDKLEQLSPELKHKLDHAETLIELEDLYLPFRPKKKTRAALAKEKGLAPLAQHILGKGKPGFDLNIFLQQLSPPVPLDLAMAGARDIVAEVIAETSTNRTALRRVFEYNATIVSRVIKGSEQTGEKFRDYFDWQETAAKAPGHRILAMFRGEQEKVLKLVIRPSTEECLKILHRRYLSKHQISKLRGDLLLAIEDSYKRLLAPSLENEFRKVLKEKADKEAIGVFSDNLKQLLLAPPLGQKKVLAIDPGYRTGCKVVCLDQHGNLLETCTVFLAASIEKREEARQKIDNLVRQHDIEAIGIGNGTAGRETESFVREINFDRPVIITLVNEDGASIYSASEIGRAEFPHYDLTVRGSVSIGRRLQDPLAELVKLDPKSIGVGQYQHDVNQLELKNGLNRVVEHCVNLVGVELNNASKELLNYIAGIGPVLAEKIIEYREQNGPFKTRAQLKEVPRLGPKAYEQCAGFLRIRNGSNPLDSSAVHPERYKLVQKMAKDQSCSIDSLLHSEEFRQKINPSNYLSEEVGLPTIIDILTELAKPGRDPRENFEHFRFSDEIHSMDDLKKDLLLPAIVTNITKFGAFADIGIKQDGLIHISQLADRFVKDPKEVVSIGQKIKVKVLDFDVVRKRISLTMRIA